MATDRVSLTTRRCQTIRATASASFGQSSSVSRVGALKCFRWVNVASQRIEASSIACAAQSERRAGTFRIDDASVAIQNHRFAALFLETWIRGRQFVGLARAIRETRATRGHKPQKCRPGQGRCGNGTAGIRRFAQHGKLIADFFPRRKRSRAGYSLAAHSAGAVSSRSAISSRAIFAGAASEMRCCKNSV